MDTADTPPPRWPRGRAAVPRSVSQPHRRGRKPSENGFIRRAPQSARGMEACRAPDAVATGSLGHTSGVPSERG